MNTFNSKIVNKERNWIIIIKTWIRFWKEIFKYIKFI